jgi:hypothetical protein
VTQFFGQGTTRYRVAANESSTLTNTGTGRLHRSRAYPAGFIRERTGADEHRSAGTWWVDRRGELADA